MSEELAPQMLKVESSWTLKGHILLLFSQSKLFPGNHLSNGFHVYELVWTPTEISLFIDGINYASLNSTFRESAMAAKIKSAVNWANNGPFDKEVNAIEANDLKIKCHQINVDLFSFFSSFILSAIVRVALSIDNGVSR